MNLVHTKAGTPAGPLFAGKMDAKCDPINAHSKLIESMPLVSMSQLLSDAMRGGYAVCYFESWNLESLQAVIEAAEEVCSPVIVGFNGGFLIHPSRARPENLAYYAGMGLTVRESTISAAFLLNETDSLAQIGQAIELRFNAVMVESPGLAMDEYRRLVKKVVGSAHPKNVSVEAQVGHLPNGSDGPNGNDQITDPALARAFVEETGIDALGVSIGNVHVLTRGKASIDIASLQRIQAEVQIPLVIHGGTGFPPEYAGVAI
ncbi:MAG: class II fructose-bisphosphate aldolase, partial [Chloroflexi bacterium]|nr:class II fructose-bisphosphate aldolase [Chloroflexota bacterium]